METISVKLYHDSEIRRFRFEFPSASSSPSYVGHFRLFMAKIKEICPNFNDADTFITWKDKDNDFIKVTSDDELKEAYLSRPDYLLRFYAVTKSDAAASVSYPKRETLHEELLEKVKNMQQHHNFQPESERVGQQQAPRETAQPTTPKRQENPAANNLHQGIVCDGCESDIRGIRYKCIVCPDFDICMSCENKRVHDEHAMIRISSPDDDTWRAAFYMNQAAMTNSPWHRHFGHHRGPHFRNGCRGRRGCSFQNEKAKANDSSQNNQKPTEVPGAHFLRDVGYAVASVLNGLGIDVDVDIEHDGQRSKVNKPTTTAKSSEAQTNEKIEVTVPEPAKPEEVVISAEPVVQTTVPLVENVLPRQESSPKEPLEWTFVEPENPISDSANSDASVEATYVSLYPNDELKVEDNQHQTALNYMLAMGFTNENGWLGKLLEAKNNDLSAVLDILHGTSLARK